MHELLLARLAVLDPTLASDTHQLGTCVVCVLLDYVCLFVCVLVCFFFFLTVADRWMLAERQRLLFPTNHASRSLCLPLFDRLGVLRWHVLLMCSFASAYLGALRRVALLLL